MLNDVNATTADAPTADGNGMAKRETPIRRVSQNDIAREANVSRVTVSLVLAGKDQTSEETRKRVLEVAKRLRYRPNLLVQGMQSGQTRTVGVISPASFYFHAQIARGIHDELVRNDWVPIQLWTDTAPAKASELEQIHRLVDRRVDGIIVWPVDASVPDVHYHEIWERDIPLVTVDRETTTHADHVGTDEETGGQLVAEHLLSLGHRHVAHLTYPNRPGSLARRREAFVRAFERGGGKVDVVMAESSEHLDRARAVLSKSKRPTAIFGATDPIAMKAYAAAYELGLKIPDDLSVVGYADFPFSADLGPALTTVRQDPYHIGEVAARIMLDRILGRASSDAPQRVRLKPEAVIRKSTAKANA
jgi:LacI family transcriptional regulator